MTKHALLFTFALLLLVLAPGGVSTRAASDSPEESAFAALHACRDLADLSKSEADGPFQTCVDRALGADLPEGTRLAYGNWLLLEGADTRPHPCPPARAAFIGDFESFPKRFLCFEAGAQNGYVFFEKDPSGQLRVSELLAPHL